MTKTAYSIHYSIQVGILEPSTEKKAERLNELHVNIPQLK